MKEKVGPCAKCGEVVFCENGFLNGVIQGDQTLLCFSCEESRQEDHE
ncbi:hypothetical protein [Halobacillus karajensis]|nr:hypothetical protein [Halobacillus karajensis]